MPLGTDIKQSIILDLKAQGADALGIVRDGIRETHQQIETLNTQFALTGGRGPTAYINELNRLGATLKKLDAEAKSLAGGQLLAAESLASQKKSAIAEIAAAEKKATLDAARDEIARAAAAQSLADQKKSAIAEAASAEKKAALDAALNDIARAAAASQLADQKKAANAQAVADARLANHEEFVAAQSLAAQKKAALGAINDAFVQQTLAAANATQQAQGGIMGWTAALNPFNRAAATTTTTTAQMAKATDDANRSSKQAGYGMLIFAHAIQDAQYGIGAVLNNIPLMVTSLGGSAGLAGTIMIAAVAANTFEGEIKTLGRQLGYLRDPLRDAMGDIDGLKEKMQALADKPMKVAADFASIRALREEIKAAEKAIADWETLKGAKTEEQQRSKKSIDEGIVEGGGAGNIEKAIVEIKKRQGTYGAGSEYHGKIAYEEDMVKRMDGLVKSQLAIGNLPGAVYSAIQARGHRAEVVKARDDLDTEQKTKIHEMVTGASTDEGKRKTLEDLLLDPKNKDILTARGIIDKVTGQNRAAAGVVLGSPENKPGGAAFLKQQEEAAKRAKKEAEEAAKAQKEAEQDETNEGVLRQREDKEARDARNKLIADEARKFRPGMEDELGRAFLSRQQRGATPQQAGDALLPRVVKRLEDMQVPVLNRDEIAGKIMADVAGKVENLIHERIGRDGGDMHTGAGSLLLDQSRKEIGRVGRDIRGSEKEMGQRQSQMFGAEFQARTGANDREAMRAGAMVQGLVAKGADPEVAMQQTYMTMIQELQQLGQKFQRFSGVQRQHGDGIRRAAGQAGRMQQTQVSGQSIINGGR